MTKFSFKEFLSRRRKGAIALVAIAGMVPTAGMLTASMNSSQMIDDRRATQDAADAVSRMHGAWTARSMNILAMNAVTETQLLTVALGSESLQGTLVEQQLAVIAALGHISSHGSQECQSRLPYGLDAAWVPICWVIHGLAMIPAIIAEVRLITIWLDYDPGHGIDVARRGLNAIEGMNRALLERHPRVIHEIGEDYAEVLDIEEFHFDDPCASDLSENCEDGRTHDGMSLPIEEGGMLHNAYRCAVMRTGTTVRSTGFYNRDFEIGRGPLMHDSGETVRDFINEETGVGEMLHDFKEAYDDGGIAHLLPKWLFLGVTEHPDWANLLGEQEEENNNSFTRRYDFKYLSICGGITLDWNLGPLTGAVPFVFESPIPQVWALPGVGAFDVSLPTEPRDMDEEFHILAFAQREQSDRLGGNVFTDMDEPHNSYGQTGIYNADGADIYSGNWRYRLMEAMRLDTPDQVADRMQDRAPSEFLDLVDVLDAVNHMSSWERINAH